MKQVKAGRIKTKRNYKVDIENYQYTYDLKLMPPITPTMKLLQFMFEQKLIGGRVGKPAKYIDDALVSVTVTQKNRLILADALLSDDFLTEEQGAISKRTPATEAVIPVKIQREESTLIYYGDTVADIEARVGYGKAFYGLIPLLYSAKSRQICLKCPYNVIFEMWMELLFSTELTTQDEVDSEAIKLAREANSRINKYLLDERIERAKREAKKNDKRAGDLKAPAEQDDVSDTSEKDVKINWVTEADCKEMLYLGSNYSHLWSRDPRGDTKKIFGLDLDNYYKIIEYYNKIHSIMYIMAVPSLVILDEQSYPGGKFELNFMTPDYKRLIEDPEFYNKAVKNLNAWLDKTLGQLKHKGRVGFHIYSRFAKCNTPIPGILNNDYLDNGGNPIEFILKKLLKLVLAVYHMDFIEETMTVGQRYIGVCHFCGGLFYRKDPARFFCKYYDDTPCNNQRSYGSCKTSNGKLGLFGRRRKALRVGLSKQ